MRFDFSSVDDVESYINVPEGMHNCRESNDLVGLRARVRVEPEEREDPQSGRRQVRMRVPYLGYEKYEPPTDVDTPETLAPVDGWRQKREAAGEGKQPEDDDFAF